MIFSRKGFDSSCGGVASPILPDGTLLSLPIPRQSSISYSELNFNGELLGPIVQDLTEGKITGERSVHLDPDLRASLYQRRPGWRPLFGQRGASQRHLSRWGISQGDLFLFFGWFREVKLVGGTYRFVKGAPDLHVLFGWLQVGQIIHVGDHDHHVPRWAAYHPHFSADYNADYDKHNVVYISSISLQINGVGEQIPGGGTFEEYRQDLCLTASSSSRSLWKLPLWFYPNNGKLPLSYHSNLSRWELAGDHALLQSAARGQEFVLDADWYPQAIGWARSLIIGRGA